MKIWWKGEPLTVGSLRWRVIDNDLLRNVKKYLDEYIKTMKGKKK